MLENYLYTTLKKIPKVDPHTHLSGSLHPEFYQPIFGKLEEIPIKRGISFKRFEKIVGRFSKILNGEENIYKALHLLAKDLYEENVLYCEVIFRPSRPTGKITQEKVISTFSDASKECRKRYDVILNLVAGVSRSAVNSNFQKALKTIKIVGEYPSEVGGISIIGESEPGVSEREEKIIKEAKKKDIKVGVHAGETLGTQKAIPYLINLGIDRIDQCVYAEPKHIEKMGEKGIGVALSPVVNKFLSKREPNIDEFLKYGVKVSLGSDNRTIFGKNTTYNYYYSIRENLLSPNKLSEVILNGVEISFLEEKEKQHLSSKLKEDLEKYKSKQSLELKLHLANFED